MKGYVCGAVLLQLVLGGQRCAPSCMLYPACPTHLSCNLPSSWCLSTSCQPPPGLAGSGAVPPSLLLSGETRGTIEHVNIHPVEVVDPDEHRDLSRRLISDATSVPSEDRLMSCLPNPCNACQNTFEHQSLACAESSTIFESSDSDRLLAAIVHRGPISGYSSHSKQASGDGETMALSPSCCGTASTTAPQSMVSMVGANPRLTPESSRAIFVPAYDGAHDDPEEVERGRARELFPFGLWSNG